MWRILSNIVEIFVYATVYMIIVLISMKIVGATISSDFERKITEEGNTGFSLIYAALFIGMALLVSSILR
jgi:TRAP-type C4-dicarboxylate transport system permease small subunit